MAQIDHKTLSPEGVQRAIDTAAVQILQAGDSGCKMLKVVEEMSRDDLTAVFKSAQARELAATRASGAFADLEFTAVPYQTDKGGQEIGAYVNLRASSDSDASVNLLFYDSGRRTGACTNIVFDGDDMIVTK